MPKIKKWNVLIYFLIFLGFSLGGSLLHLLSDYYWYRETGFTGFYAKMLASESGLGLGAALLVWLALFLNYTVARRVARRPFIIIEPGASITAPHPQPQLAELRPALQTVILILTILTAFLCGSWASDHWDSFLKFLHSVPFGQSDPVFNRDIGYYVFTLPFERFLLHLATVTLIFSFLTAAGIYLINSRVYFVDRGLRLQEGVKVHLSVLAGIFCLLLLFYFEFRMFGLLTTQRALAAGPGYADLRAALPALKILRLLAAVSAILVGLSPWVGREKTLIAAAAILLGGLVASKAYTVSVQKFEVAPNEIALETPYIRQGIAYTRRAYGLTDIQELQFDPQSDLTPQMLRDNEATLNNIRLWEHETLLTTFSQLQEIRTYYDFLDADNDRYWIDGKYRQVMLSVRELAPENLPSRIWINEHLTYTHGYGLCVGPVNRISPEGLPELFLKDIPPASTNPELKVTRPEIYYGEAPTGYAIVRTRSKEFDYPAGEDNVYTSYAGTGGVPIRNFLRRMLFALEFGEFKILLSGDITPESRILYYRSLRERLAKAAPFLRFDDDPYIVIAKDGRLFWMVDGYTLSDRYPYSERMGGINYIRNSVKATVDAYNGTVDFYIADPQDPIVQTYARIFPGHFKPLDAMPEDLRAHIRYPKTLMSVQAGVYATYHMGDPQVFYNKEDLWKIPLRQAGGRQDFMEPYYTVMKLAEVGLKEEFILMVPFTPARKENMIAWMAARCDAPNYGKLLVYNFPKQRLVYGPQQIESRIDQDPDISKQLTLWDQGGSRVLRGNLLVIPVERSLLYVQPLYLEASNGGLPELKRIIVAYGDRIAMEENLELSLMRIFGRGVGMAEANAPARQAGVAPELRSLARQANERYERAQQAARRGDWAGYGAEMDALGRLLKTISEMR